MEKKGGVVGRKEIGSEEEDELVEIKKKVIIERKEERKEGR